MAPWLPGYGLGASTGPGPELLERALELGLRSVDTAPIYGRALEDLAPLAHRFRITLKLFPGEDGSEPLRRLGVEAVDTVLLHRPGPVPALPGRKGISTYGVEQALAGLEWCEVLQFEHSLLNQAVYRAVRARRAKAQRLVARSVLCQGLLSHRRHHHPRLWGPIAAELQELENLAGERGYSLPGLALRFALDSPGVDEVLIGVSSRAELEEACRVAASPPISDWSTLERFDRSGLPEVVRPELWNLSG